MGIIAHAEEYLAAKMLSAAKKTADGVSACSGLSPNQLQKMEAKRATYLDEKPDMSGEEAVSAIQKNMGAVGVEVYQAYLEQLDTIYSPIDVISENFDEENRIRYADITKWVTDAEEQSLDKLVNVYHVLSEEECNIALIYHRTQSQCQISIGVVNTSERQSEPAIADKYYSRIIGAIKGNFPGADIIGVGQKGSNHGVGIPECLVNVTGDTDSKRVKSIVAVSNVASEKSENFISQSMEKLLDGIVPSDESEEYTIVLLAKPIREQLESKNRLYELYSALKPYETWQVNTGISESTTEGASFVLGGNMGVSVSGTAGMSAGAAGIVGAGVNQSRTMGGNFGLSFFRSSNVSVTLGKNENLTQTFANYGIKHTLEIIEAQLKRIEESSALGMWEFASYIISDNPVIANNVAHMYLALTQGEKSYLTKAAVNFWDGDLDTDAAKTILTSVQNLQHPIFGLKTSLDDEWLMYPTLVTPTTPLSGKELAKALNFPRKSVSGLPVFDVVSFGREPHSLLDNILDLDIGCGYHMRKEAPAQKISLSKEKLTSHTFITGSTGSGKSNTIYTLLDKLCLSGDRDTHFLVVEPAKGEYKDVLGGYDGVSVYGTNPRKSNLLRLNPFSFPDDIQVFEHIDRLVEIFNACWPMYAAMPAVLKDAIEAAYVECGWSLAQSVCTPLRFPTFSTVMKKVKEVIDKDYSADTKGDYVGALVTRLKSLTNGINGQIFCAEDEIANGKLFDENVIVDLSRVGSMETKSLLMGILVMKLQEYRMSQGGMNEDLKHITVLEEAHNLLRCTSSEQTQESSNLQGKSVEMLANAIAEMRTYGEGFIIADQSPGLMDMSVIRNTNTKIIMRLPDESDRILVGRAASLNDSQITELARLERGVAAVFQNDWLEPVLCRVDLFDDDNHSKRKPFTYQWHGDTTSSAKEKLFKQMLFGATDCEELSAEEVDQIKRWIDYVNLGRDAKELLLKTLHPNKKLTDNEQGFLLYCLIKGKSLIQQQLDNTTSPDAVQSIMNSQIADMLGVSLNLAEEIRKRAFLYAAHQVEEDTIQYNDLLYYGGVR